MQNVFDRTARLMAGVAIMLGVLAALSHVSGAQAALHAPPTLCSDGRCGIDMVKNSQTNPCPSCSNGNPSANPPEHPSTGNDCGWTKTVSPRTCDKCYEGASTCTCYLAQMNPPRWACKK
jgi:hypothetical protein